MGQKFFTVIVWIALFFHVQLGASPTMQIDPLKGYAIRKADERGFFDREWLKTYHTFSFGEYYDPQFMGFRTLRVINEDTVSAGKGFATHSHRNMEIITIVLEGAVAHKDSMENERVIHAYEMQVMSAGRGVTHSEYNPSSKRDSHFLQIWITPNQKDIQPRYQQRKISQNENEWILLASKTGEQESLVIHQDAKIYMLHLTPHHSVEKTLDKGRYGWLQVVEGTVQFQGKELQKGDGIALSTAMKVTLDSSAHAKILFFDLN